MIQRELFLKIRKMKEIERKFVGVELEKGKIPVEAQAPHVQVAPPAFFPSTNSAKVGGSLHTFNPPHPPLSFLFLLRYRST